MRLIAMLALLGLFAAPAAAQQRKARCNTTPPNSSWLATGPVYRNCEVDQVARPRGGHPSLGYQPLAGVADDPRRCFEVELRFVVDTTGAVERATVEVLASDDHSLTEAVISSLPHLQYQPARISGEPVRQVVIYGRGVSSGGTSRSTSRTGARTC